MAISPTPVSAIIYYWPLPQLWITVELCKHVENKVKLIKADDSMVVKVTSNWPSLVCLLCLGCLTPGGNLAGGT